MISNALAAILTIAIMVFALGAGLWLGLKLVRGSDLSQDQPRLKKIVSGTWIAGAGAAGAWFFNRGQISFENACFAFVLVSIAIFAAFRHPKGS